MDPYSIGDADFDSVFQHSTMTKKIPVFYVPILFHQRFNQRWFIEAGPQLGLIHQSTDIFNVSEFDGDVSYEKSVKDEYKHIDVGYYYGLVNVSKNPDYKIKNSYHTREEKKKEVLE